MLARTRELTEKIRGWYEAFEFHRVYQAVNEFAIVDLSSFYLDVLKDRMYTFAPTSKERRSAQTVLWQITEALTRLVAPILTFTADEVWEYLPQVEGREASVHLAQFPTPSEIFSEDPAALLDEWKQLFAIRDAALVVLEEARQAKTIGKGLEADLDIYAKGAIFNVLKRHQGGLKELINVSSVALLEWGTHSGPVDARQNQISIVTRRLRGFSFARLRLQMRPLLEFHAPRLQLRRVGERLRPLPGRAPRNEHRPAATRGRRMSLSIPRPGAPGLAFETWETTKASQSSIERATKA